MQASILLLTLLSAPLSLCSPIANPLADADALAAPSPAAWPAPDPLALPADDALASDIDSALQTMENSLQLIQNLNGVDGCNTASCIGDMAPALTECANAQQAGFANPQQDVKCLGDIVNAAVGFTSNCGACLSAAAECAKQ